MSPSLRDQMIREVQTLTRAASHCGRQAEPHIDAATAVELAAFLAASDDLFVTQENQDVIESLAAYALDQIARRRLEIHWVGGLTGISWQLVRLARRSGKWDQGFSEDLDVALSSMLKTDRWFGNYDLIIGLAGFGIYALEHPCQDWRERLIKQILWHLERLAEKSADGLSWHTRPELLPEHQRRRFPAGYHNLGLAHGIPGVIGLLARAVTEGVEAKAAGEMLEPAMTWLLAQQEIVEESGFHFGNQCEEPVSSRPLAWCYGDFGVTCALFRAAWATGREDWRRTAMEIGHSCAGRRGNEAAIRDPGLCHGSVGAGLIFLRLSQHSGDASFVDAANYWMERSLAMRRRDFGEVAGVFSMQGSWDSPQEVPSWGLLTGLAGVGMGYLSALGLEDRSWDAALLTDLPLAHRA